MSFEIYNSRNLLPAIPDGKEGVWLFIAGIKSPPPPAEYPYPMREFVEWKDHWDILYYKKSTPI
jgi:hypothetical protein